MRYNNRRNRSPRRKPATISIDKLVAKAVAHEHSNIYVDDYNYSQFEISDVLKQNIYNKGYSVPTKIQYQVIPKVLNGADILGLASTGSGKTAAFLIPLIDRVLKGKLKKCLIILPTRELAMQVQDELRQLSNRTRIYSALIIGGTNMGSQIRSLRNNPQFIIATPGRLKDVTDRRLLDLKQVDSIVLDEVDRMLDMGFIDTIHYIMHQIGQDRQTLFFSATMNNKAENIANKILSNPFKVQVEQQAPGKNVDQDVVRLRPGDSKLQVLIALLRQTELSKVLVFTSTKRGADRLCKELAHQRIYVEALHGDKRQSQRSRIIDGFKKGNLDVLIATDVASRGLDVNNISHVINYDMPQSYEDYIHRIGRTGRAGKKGFALTFV